MSAPHVEHAADEVAHAHSPEEEIAHAKEHAKENIFWFLGFFTLILFAVLNYELSGVDHLWSILALAAARALMIAFFFNWLIHSFSFVIRTICFTVIFFAGMIFLSMWGSTLRHFGDPIELPNTYEKASR